MIAFYNPHDRDCGQCCQFSLKTGETEAVWITRKAPRVTCPQLIQVGGAVKLVLTTAVEGMDSEQLRRSSNSGCLFIGETSFDDVPDTPIFEIPRE
jgi:hypothetical protein